MGNPDADEKTRSAEELPPEYRRQGVARVAQLAGPAMVPRRGLRGVTWSTAQDHLANADLATIEHDGRRQALEIFGFQPCVPGKTAQHPRADFFVVMEGEYDVAPSEARQGTVLTGLAFHLPPDA